VVVKFVCGQTLLLQLMMYARIKSMFFHNEEYVSLRIEFLFVKRVFFDKTRFF